ncbi:MAG: 6-phosphogluconolactonase [Xanthomonadaceae bacterium]|nr:6-phosphogluconolactonase [Xanthomonadaceae bacterium]MDE2085359.1 6-phosphogluconolactonase [Xanthomonadaceae bacterium]MDE2257350.1 6-phosphogluconolactonase [Xanthomonadaceae bacterium]
MSIAVDMRVFSDANAQAEALAAAVGTCLRAAIAARGGAWLAVPGGVTPRKFLGMLAQQKLDWARVSVTLTDERCVAADDARSNEGMLRQVLIAPTQARFAPLQSAVPRPFDAVVLGMGADGHCASLFVDGDNIATALRADAPESTMPMRSPSVPEARVTLTLAALVHTRGLFVLIRGEEKRRTLESALRGAEPLTHAPIRAVLENAPVAPQIYWCP